MSDNGNKENGALGDELQIYELGFHLLPNLAEENLAGEVSVIKSIIERNDGLFIGEEGLPKSMKLAYDMSKVIDNKTVSFDTAYFGWIKFEANTESVRKMTEELRKINNILRFLLIKSVRESKIASRKPGILSKSQSPTKNPKTEESSKEGPISEAQVEKAIEELVVE